MAFFDRKTPSSGGLSDLLDKSTSRGIGGNLLGGSNTGITGRIRSGVGEMIESGRQDIISAYETYLGRTPSEDEVNQRIEDIKNSPRTLADHLAGIQNSEEAQASSSTGSSGAPPPATAGTGAGVGTGAGAGRTERSPLESGLNLEDFSSPEPVDIGTLPELDFGDESLLNQIGSLAGELTSGQIPADVLANIERSSAKLGIASGVRGQAGEFITARDIGRTSLDLAESGAKLGLGVEELRTQRDVAQAAFGLQSKELAVQTDMFNRELDLKSQAFRADMQQWRDKFSVMAAETDIKRDQLDLMTLELVSRNQQFMYGLINDLSIHNSKKAIAGVQNAVNTMSSFWNVTNTSILQLMGLA